MSIFQFDWWAFSGRIPPIPTPTPPAAVYIQPVQYDSAWIVQPIQYVSGIIVSAFTQMTSPTWFTGAVLQSTIDYPYAFKWVYQGLDSSDWTQIVWTVKQNQTDADSAAVLTIVLSNPGAGSDGLTIQNGAPPVSPVVASDGALTLSTANVNGQTATTVTVAINARGMELTAAGSFFWESCLYISGVKQGPLDGGRFNVNQSVRQAYGQSS
jgi:hypothetical protein